MSRSTVGSLGGFVARARLGWVGGVIAVVVVGCSSSTESGSTSSGASGGAGAGATNGPPADCAAQCVARAKQCNSDASHCASTCATVSATQYACLDKAGCDVAAANACFKGTPSSSSGGTSGSSGSSTNPCAGQPNSPSHVKCTCDGATSLYCTTLPSSQWATNYCKNPGSGSPCVVD